MSTPGINVTVTDLEYPKDTTALEIMDDYVVVCAGSCYQDYIQVSYAKDGTQTHVITIKGVNPVLFEELS